jgi:drug/metabolite transporter (DMT)-like permease
MFAFAFINFILVSVFWGAGFIWTKQCLEYLEPNSFLTLRFLSSGLILLIPCLRQKTSPTRTDISWGALLGIFVGVGFIFQTIGLELTTAGRAGFITSTYIVWTPLAAWLWMRRAIPKILWICVTIALSGMALLSFSDADLQARIGDLWVLASAVLFALQVVGVDRLPGKINSMWVSSLQILSMGVLCLFAALSFESFSLPTEKGFWIPLALCATLGTIYPFLAQIFLQKYLKASLAAMIMSLEAVFALLFGHWILDETLNQWQGLGCILVFSATLCFSYISAGKAKVNPPN